MKTFNILIIIMLTCFFALTSCKKGGTPQAAVPRLKVINVNRQYANYDASQTGSLSFIDITDDGQSDIVIENDHFSVLATSYVKALEWNKGYSKDSMYFFAVKVNDQLNASNSNWVLNNFPAGTKLDYTQNNRGDNEYIYEETLNSSNAQLDPPSKFGIYGLNQPYTYAGFAIKLKSDNRWHNGYIMLSLGGDSYTGSYVAIQKIVYSTIPDDPVTTGEN